MFKNIFKIKEVIKYLIYFLLPLFVLFPHLNQDLTPYDTGLYHKHIVSIIKTEGVILGSANLHDRIGFNNSNFYLVALIEILFPSIPSQYILNPAVYFFSLFYLLYKGINPRRAKLKYRILALGLFISIGLYPLFIVSISPDTMAYCLSTILIFRFIERDSFQKLELEVAIYAFLVTIKFSSIFLILFFIPAFVNKSKFIQSRHILRYILLFISILLPWIFTNYLISGFLVYPVLDFPLLSPDWKLDKELAQSHIQLIKNWALTQGVQSTQFSGISEYIEKWWQTYSLNNYHHSYFIINLYRITFIFSLILGLKVAIGKYKISKRELANVLILILVNLFWFFTAPDPRFSYATLLLLPMLIISLSLTNIKNYFPSLCFERIIIFAFIGFSISRIFFWDLGFLDKIRKFKEPLRGNFVPTKYGFITFEPESDLCWDASIFCNPYKNRNLILHEGKWLMITVGKD
ncbi:LIC_10190 family membrane protein [Leptospira levettii]|uniref:LIC_10190 family membrane protein n=1 Tax=Leptospira levettii TaxID=2023178 RepID=UPI000C2ABD2B|nr:hypothetical protein [Leptospira levettii]MCW7472067.1 hypothetical protein [Leptospira levettii]PJZ89447.1 hypothetical protein CH368_06700 [Leptospira levettii]